MSNVQVGTRSGFVENPSVGIYLNIGHSPLDIGYPLVFSPANRNRQHRNVGVVYRIFRNTPKQEV